MGDVVNHPIHSPLHRVGDSGADLLENVVRDFRVASRHPIHGLDGTHHDRFTVGSDIAVNSYASYWKQCCEVLPGNFHFTTFCCGFKFFLYNGTSFTNHGHAFWCQISKGSNGQTGSGEGLAFSDVDVEGSS